MKLGVKTPQRGRTPAVMVTGLLIEMVTIIVRDTIIEKVLIAHIVLLIINMGVTVRNVLTTVKAVIVRASIVKTARSVLLIEKTEANVLIVRV